MEHLSFVFWFILYFLLEEILAGNVSYCCKLLVGSPEHTLKCCSLFANLFRSPNPMMDRIDTFHIGSLANTIGPFQFKSSDGIRIVAMVGLFAHQPAGGTSLPSTITSYTSHSIQILVSEIVFIASQQSYKQCLWISLCLLDDLSVVPILPKAGHWGLIGQRKGWRNWRPSVLIPPGKSSLVNTMITSICGWYAWFLQRYVPKFLALPTAWSEKILSKTMLQDAKATRMAAHQASLLISSTKLWFSIGLESRIKWCSTSRHVLDCFGVLLISQVSFLFLGKCVCVYIYKI